MSNEIPLWNSVEMHDMKIGSRIRAERESQGISRTELAKFAGIATSTPFGFRAWSLEIDYSIA